VGADEILVENELRMQVEARRSVADKAGFDATAAGSAPGATRCCDHKLRQFQEPRQQVLFLIGDFTGMIGDSPEECHPPA